MIEQGQEEATPLRSNHKHVAFSQDHVRRAGDAIGNAVREDSCRDVYRLARIALEAALPFADDVRALLDPPAISRPAKQPPRRRTIAAEAAEHVA